LDGEDHGRSNGKVSVREKTGRKMRWLSLDKSLQVNFPPDEMFVNQGTMEEYWAVNGKIFDWAGLPTELKENVIQYCVSGLSSYEDDFHRYPAARKLSPRAHQDRVRHHSELVQKLGDWSSLPSVSVQIRALTLRLLFNGSATYPQGFCVTSNDYACFNRRLRRLDKYHQMTQRDSVVKSGDRTASLLARQYKDFPQIYSHLERYATFKHGIRKICLQFDFLGCLYFFKVTVSGINLHRPESYVTCDVFDQLPYLNQIVVDLPTSYDQVRGHVDSMLFHESEPCPRILHQLIYEQVALELVVYKDVAVRFFIDVDEEQRFTAMRESAQLALKFTAGELTELYADDDGGIELDEGDVGTYLIRNSIAGQLSISQTYANQSFTFRL
jgi:hypothetical protein